MASPILVDEERHPISGAAEKWSHGIANGIEVLKGLHEFWVVQERTWKESVKEWEPRARFSVENANRERLLFVQEEGELKEAHRFWYKNSRELYLVAKNEAGQEVAAFNRPFNKKAAYFSWLNLESTGWNVEVTAPPGQPVGCVKQVTAFARKALHLLDAQGKERLHIRGPVKEMQIWKEDVQFDLFTQADEHIGAVTLKSSDSVKTDMVSSRFLVKINAELPATDVLMVLAGTLLIEFMCYEDVYRNSSHWFAR